MAFEPALHAAFVAWRAVSSQVFYFNSENFILDATYDVPLIQDIFASDRELWAAFQTPTNTTILRQLVNPATGADTNSSPAASFTFSPARYRWRAPISGLVYITVQGRSSSDTIATFTGISVDSLSVVPVRHPKQELGASRLMPIRNTSL